MLHLDTGNTAFMLVASALVLLMTPALAFFYGGLVGHKSVGTIMFQSFVSMGWTTLLWVVCGYSLSFSGDLGGVIGDLDMAMLHGVALDTPSPNPTVPALVFVAFQMMFAIITPALITGAFANRVTFKAYMIFLTLWLFAVYFPFVHMVWGGGLLQRWGVLDFAGGIVVHTTAGIAALAAVFYVGKRKVKESAPHNIPFVALGTGLLWFGWYGFNAGSEGIVDSVTAVAFLNTHVAAAAAGMTWLLVEWRREGKPKFVGFLTGAVAGLATVTPASGFVSPGAAIVIGVAAGLVCFAACSFKTRRGWDDALDVWGVHGVGGMTGTILLGVFARKAWNPAGADGLLEGNSGFFVKQCVGVAVAAVWAFVFTYGMLWLIDRVTPVRASDDHEALGLDEALHGETAYQHG
jgi:Amt family ammonium transporter